MPLSQTKRAMPLSMSKPKRMTKSAKKVILVSDSDEGVINMISDSEDEIPTRLDVDLGNDADQIKRPTSIGSMITCVPIPEWDRRPDQNGNMRTHYTIDELEFMMDSQCPPECSCKEICQLRYPDRKF